MTTKESKFLEQLEQRAGEQKRLVATEIMPTWARGVGEWLVVNPWRVLVPLSAILYIFLRLVFGDGVREVVLAIFGGFRL